MDPRPRRRRSTPARGATSGRATLPVAEAEHVVDDMGTRAHVIVVARTQPTAELLATSAVARLRELECKWSRFLPDSELSRLNARAGSTIRVSHDVELLIERSVEAWHRTDGRFDPTVLKALDAAGYDDDFSHVAARHDSTSTTDAAAAPGCADIRIGPDGMTLPLGTAIDPGGIGKGLAADLSIDLVMTGGATGACINVGGDLRVAGTTATGRPWSVAVEHPLTEACIIADVELHDEALVSTWRTRRVWGAEENRRHHLIDPATGTSAWNGLAGVTVTAPEGWWAEALATAIFLAGPDDAPTLARRHGVGAILVRDDGSLLGIGALRDVVGRAVKPGQ